MKIIFILSSLLFTTSLFAQKQKKRKEPKTETLWVETEGTILQGSIALGAAPELFVGQEYFFTIISNNNSLDLKIDSENLMVTFDPESKKTTGGLTFSVVPIDTGDCRISLSVGSDKKTEAGLMSQFYHASNYTMPPVFISGIRTGELLPQLKKNAQLECKYDPASGIFNGYTITSWSAMLGKTAFQGTGTTLSEELIEAVNKASEGEILRLSVELENNSTGFKTSEAVFLIK